MALIVNGRGIAGIRSGVSAGPSQIDSDAQAFITAANITNATQKTAIDILVKSLKSYGIWTKMKAIYPMVGGTKESHKFNLKDPRDLPAAFTLAFSIGWTHSPTGAKPNGTDYANTYLNALSSLTNNNYHLSHYSRTQKITGNELDLGCIDGQKMLGLDQYYAGVSSKAFVCGDYISGFVSINDTNTLGLLLGSRTSQTSAKMFMNSVKRGNTLTSSNPNALPNIVFYIGSNNSTSIGAYEFSTKECAFASIGDGLTDTEAANLYTVVQAYQTTLGRQV